MYFSAASSRALTRASSSLSSGTLSLGATQPRELAIASFFAASTASILAFFALG